MKIAIFALFLLAVGCTATAQELNKASEDAILARADDDSTVAIIASSTAAPIRSDIYSNRVSLLLYADWLMRVKDPLTASLTLIGSANHLMDRMVANLEKGEQPQDWQMRITSLMLDEAQVRCAQIPVVDGETDLRAATRKCYSRSRQRFQTLESRQPDR